MNRVMLWIVLSSIFRYNYHKSGWGKGMTSFSTRNWIVRTIPIRIKVTTLFKILDFMLSNELSCGNEETGRKIVDLSAREKWWFVIELYSIASEGIMKIQKHIMEVDTRIPFFQPRLKTMMLISEVNLINKNYVILLYYITSTSPLETSWGT